MKQDNGSDLELQNAARSRSLEVENTIDVSSSAEYTVRDQIGNEKAENANFESDSDLIFQNPLIDLEQDDVNVGQDQNFPAHQTPEKEVKVKQTELERLSDESDHDFERRVKKHNFLKDAHRFVELKKIDSNILPFDLHKYSDFGDKNNSNIEGIAEERNTFPNAETYGQEMAEILTHSKETFSSVVIDDSCGMDNSAKTFCDIGDKLTGEIDPGDKNNFRTKESKTKLHVGSVEKPDTSEEISESMKGETKMDKADGSKDGENTLNLMVDSGIQIETDCDTTCTNDSKTSRTGEDEDIEPFEVYNIETALPNINWETLEESLKKASEEEKQRQEVSLRIKDKTMTGSPLAHFLFGPRYEPN